MSKNTQKKYAARLVVLMMLISIVITGSLPAAMAEPDPLQIVETMAGGAAGIAYNAAGSLSANFAVSTPQLYVETRFENSLDEEVSGNFYLAIYSAGGRLAYVESKVLSAAAAGSASVVFDADVSEYQSEGCLIKVFAWDADDVPLAEAAEASYKNLALRRAAYQSGAVDENYTATLVTDGIVSEPVLRSFADGPWVAATRYYMEWIYVDLGEPTDIANVTTTWGGTYATRYQIQFSDDAVTWTTPAIAGAHRGSNAYSGGGGGTANPFGYATAAWANAADACGITGVTARYVRILCESCSGLSQSGETYTILGISVNDAAVDGYYASNGFDSYWKSKAGGEQWVYVDLGADSALVGANVVWGGIYATDYEIQTSDDAKIWTTAANASGAANTAVPASFEASGRYLRVLCSDSSETGYIIKEIEAYGSNGLTYEPNPLPEPEADGTQYLRGGNWKLERATEVDADGVTLSQAGYDDSTWLPATVPSTTLVSYLNAGAVPDPYYDSVNLSISDTYFTTDFWYRDSFEIPASKEGKDVWLNFDAINYRADVYFNGHFMPNGTNPSRAKSIEGGFIRGKFDVTDYVNYGGENYLAVFVQMNDTPWGYTNTTYTGVGLATTIGSYITRYTTLQGLAIGPWPNGGNIGIDNPTFHASLGWDWMPTVRGRDTGIYKDVFISYTDGVEMLDPWMITDLDIQEIPREYTAAPMEVTAAATQPDGQSGVGLGNIFDASMATEWVGDAAAENPSFTAELAAPAAVNTIVVNWGEVLPNRAYESQNAARFKLEVSEDGSEWRNYDAREAGEGYDAYAGTDYYEGGNIVNVVSGPATDAGAAIARSFQYLRFTVLQKMTSQNSDQGVLPPKIQKIDFYSATKSALEGSGNRRYALDASKAALTFKADVRNSTDADAEATVSGVITPGGLTFSKTVTVPAGTTQAVSIDDILMEYPELWWPNTYGAQPLYTVSAALSRSGVVSDTKEFKFGVREFTYPLDANYLAIYCNGARIVAKGGNWGMDDALKNDDAERYDNKVRLHAEENMTMIRNWVGQTSSEAFYEACDKYGILIWDDFWLANPYDGPNPKDTAMFLENAADKVKSVRSHAALAVYCGRNESNPAAALATPLLRLVAAVGNATQPEGGTVDNTRYYFANSAGRPVGSGGGYSLANYNGAGSAQGMKQYYTNVTSNVIRSERGIPNVPTAESIRKFVAPENQWPISEVWAHHDWTYNMNGPANTYMNALKSYMPKITWTFPNSIGGSQNPSPAAVNIVNYENNFKPMLSQLAEWYTLDDFSRVAQLINYENHAALFQALTTRRAGGLLMWMSQSSWPSFMWQTYDYYLDTNGGYFGVKTGNQPTQAIWRPTDNAVILSNLTPKSYGDVKTELKIYDLNGGVAASETYATPYLGPDTTGLTLSANISELFAESATDMVFIRLIVKAEDGSVLGSNTYWHNKETYLAHQALNDLAQVSLTAVSSDPETLANGNVRYTLTLKNDTGVPAVQTRIRTVSAATGEDVLPTFYSDNYFALMPGESKTVTAEFNPRYLEGGAPEFELGGWNTSKDTVAVK
ncbi:MAG: discoidin domain-containing protein [Oscillospiraceae bacterium]|nr:discoidin domain-containing protein [Oscillospiraceae bacterium]